MNGIPPARAVTSGPRAAFLGVALALGVLALGSNVPSALYQVYADRFGFAPLTITLVFATYCLALLPALMAAGPVLDRWGPLPLALAGLVLMAAGSVAFAAASSTGWLYLARAIQGVAVGASTGALTTCLVAAEPTGNRARASRVAAMVLCAGAGSGPVLAGVTASWLPAPTVLAYLIEVALLVSAVPALLAAVAPRRAPVGAAPAGAEPPRASAAREPGLATASALSALTWAVTAVFLSLVPSLTGQLLHTDNLAVTGTAAGLLLIAAGGVQPIARRLRAPSAVTAGLALLAVGCALLLVASNAPGLGLLLFAVAITGAGHGLMFAATLVLAARATGRRSQGTTWAVYYTVTYLGEALPVIGIGVLTEHLGLTGAVRAFLVAAGAAAVIVLAVRAWRRRRPRDGRWRDGRQRDGRRRDGRQDGRRAGSTRTGVSRWGR